MDDGAVVGIERGFALGDPVYAFGQFGACRPPGAGVWGDELIRAGGDGGAE
jgi:hypothetical protein